MRSTSRTQYRAMRSSAWASCGTSGAVTSASWSLSSTRRCSDARGWATRASRRDALPASLLISSEVGSSPCGRSSVRLRRMSLSTWTSAPMSFSVVRIVRTSSARAPSSGFTKAPNRLASGVLRKVLLVSPYETCRTSPGCRSRRRMCRSLLASRSLATVTPSPLPVVGSRTISGVRAAICKLMKEGRVVVPLVTGSLRSRSSVKMSVISARSLIWSWCLKGRSLVVSTQLSWARRNFICFSSTRLWSTVQLDATNCTGSHSPGGKVASRPMKRLTSLSSAAFVCSCSA
mmetsp:Transcript_75266/g.194043  ORF Transcript_75266/g.194043 Transcript_75266/m.194043 type:complete len:289 (+) Transcript_75266:285-1151(+)